jgi:hypothetical protein
VKSRKISSDADFISRARARQQNILWPESLMNSNEVNKLFWRGSSNPSLVQRIGAWLFGATFIGMGIVTALLTRGDRSFFLVLFSSGLILAGAVIFRAGFRTRGPEGGAADRNAETKH